MQHLELAIVNCIIAQYKQIYIYDIFYIGKKIEKNKNYTHSISRIWVLANNLLAEDENLVNRTK